MGLLYMHRAAASFSDLPRDDALAVLDSVAARVTCEEIHGARMAAIALYGRIGAAVLRSSTKQRDSRAGREGAAATGSAGGDTAVPRWALDGALAVAAAPHRMQLKQAAELGLVAQRLQQLPRPAALLARITATLVRRLCTAFNLCQALSAEGAPATASDNGATGSTPPSDDANQDSGSDSSSDEVYERYGTGRHDITGADAATRDAAAAAARASLDAERVYLYHALKQVVPVLAKEDTGDEAGSPSNTRQGTGTAPGQSLVAGELSQASAIVQHLVLIELDPAKATTIPVFLAVVRVSCRRAPPRCVCWKPAVMGRCSSLARV